MSMTMSVSVPDVQDYLQKEEHVHTQNHNDTFPDVVSYAFFLVTVCLSLFFIVSMKIKGLVCVCVCVCVCVYEQNKQNKKTTRYKQGNKRTRYKQQTRKQKNKV